MGRRAEATTRCDDDARRRVVSLRQRCVNPPALLRRLSAKLRTPLGVMMRALTRPDLDDVHAQFEAWRAAKRGRRVIPERLLRAAVALLDRYPPSTICRRLRLNATRFARARQSLAGKHAKARGGGGAFVELAALGVAASEPQLSLVRLDALNRGAECRVVLEPATGGRLSVELARVDAAWLEVACRALLAASAGPNVADQRKVKLSDLTSRASSGQAERARESTRSMSSISRLPGGRSSTSRRTGRK